MRYFWYSSDEGEYERDYVRGHTEQNKLNPLEIKLNLAIRDTGLHEEIK